MSFLSRFNLLGPYINRMPRERESHLGSLALTRFFVRNLKGARAACGAFPLTINLRIKLERAQVFNNEAKSLLPSTNSVLSFSLLASRSHRLFQSPFVYIHEPVCLFTFESMYETFRSQSKQFAAEAFFNTELNNSAEKKEKHSLFFSTNHAEKFIRSKVSQICIK